MKLLNLILVLSLGVILLAGCGETTAPPTPPVAPTGGETQPPSVTATSQPTEPPTPAPTPAGPFAVVAEVINLVDAHPLPGNAWEAALAKMVIYTGGEVWAKEESTARLMLDQDMIRVAPNTIFTLEQPSGTDKVKLNLQEGQVWLNIEGLEEGQELEVETPSAVASIRGTRFSVRLDRVGNTIVSVVKGAVDLTSAGVTKAVEEGLQSKAAPGLPPADPEPISLEERIRWGMADGANLDVLLPAGGEVFSTDFQGQLYDPAFTYDGDHFFFSSYDPSTFGDSVVNLIDLQQGAPVDSPIPPQSYGFTANPAGEGITYQHFNGVDSESCYLPTLTSEPICTSVPGYSSGMGFWSPDGQWILFYTNEPGSLPITSTGLNLWKSKPDFTQKTQLTFSERGFNNRQTWSPDARQIAWVNSFEYDGAGDLYVANADGSDARLVLPGVAPGGSTHVAWSPDGEWLVMPRSVGGLWGVHPDGSDAYQIPGTPGGFYRDIAWSPTPDGYPLFFKAAEDYRGTYQLYYIPAQGADAILMGEASWGPVWSGDGSRVMFAITTTVDSVKQIYTTQVIILPVFASFWK